MNRQNLLESIATTISDYRLGEIPPMTTDHVDRWVSQFDNDEQLIILAEMDHLLSKYYISKSKAESFIDKILSPQGILGDDEDQFLPNLQFLDIQTRGNSQKDLLKLANKITMSKYGININQKSSNSIVYVYLDDCLFSGNRALSDIRDWLNNSIFNSRRPIYLFLIFLGCHTSGKRYFENKIQSLAKEKKVYLTVETDLTFHNLFWETKKYECLWPTENIDDEFVTNFVNIVHEKSKDKSFNLRLFRPNGTPTQETLFSTPEARDIVESAFLRKGAFIVSLPKNRQPSMRPMGYEYLESLGFGSIFITYRNIANNCPLVLWWGDTSYPSSHPFSKWYPLFPRKVNESSSIPNQLFDFER